MAEPETEIDTLDRLEAALARIAAHAGGHNPQQAAAGPDRVAVAAALDRIIGQLRAALAAADGEEQI